MLGSQEKILADRNMVLSALPEYPERVTINGLEAKLVGMEDGEVGVAFWSLYRSGDMQKEVVDGVTWVRKVPFQKV